MFEKDAEEYVNKDTWLYESAREDAKYHFQKGAEFGYNKANEWHYMKDVNCYEDLPHNEDVYYAYVVNVGAYDKPTIERKLGCFAEFEFDVMAYHVIAWKEIILPSEPMRSLNKEEQKNYTEAINKVYKPTGVKLFDKENE